MKITEALAAEHLIFLGIFDEIERALPRLATLAELRTMAALIERILTPHAATEKVTLLALDHVLSHQGALQRLHHDHHEIDERLKQVRAASRCAEARRLLKISIASSREHFRLEEKELFPLLEKSLQADTLRELARTWRGERAGARAAARM